MTTAGPGRHVRNPFLVLGAVVLAGSSLTYVAADAPTTVKLVQVILPVAVGIALIGLGWRVDESTIQHQVRTIYLWTALGTIAFTVVGIWFGQLSRLFDTSLLLAVYSSLASGAAFGVVIGLYAARLHRANQRLTERNELMSEFAGIVSHDLRNPLNVAAGRLDLARDTHPDDEDLETAHDALDRMDELIANLLALAKQGQTIGTTESVSLSAVARSAWSTVETDSASLDVETDATIPADEERLRQLLENLFRNSLEHSRSDVTVTVGTMPNGFYVADDGPGIPPAKRDLVFNRGYTTREGSTGFGLAIVEQIATAHGWTVSITESEAGGARFEFTTVA